MIDRLQQLIERYARFFLAGTVLLVLFLTSRHSYLLFHSLAELFSVVVAGSIFILAWNSRHFQENGFILFLGITHLFVGALDLIHTLAYQGMGVFQTESPNLPTQLWIAARYLQSISFFAAPLFLHRRVRPVSLIVIYGTVVSVLLASIFVWDIFPIMYIPGAGLTPIKKVSEYLIAALFGGAIFLFYRYRAALDPEVLRALVLAGAVSIAAELSFTFYVDVYGFFNLLGHYFKIIAFYFIYKAVIEVGMLRPYELLFRDLSRREEALRISHLELSQANRRLQAVLQALPVAVWIADGQGQIVDRNAMVAAIWGGNTEDLSLEQGSSNGKPGQSQKERPDEWALSRALTRGETSVGETVNIWREDRSQATLLASTAPIHDTEGQISGAVVVAQDITELQLVKAALEHYAAQLEISNKELEQFAFVASHDLQEPLRKIQAFGGRLKSLLESRLSQQETDYLDRMLTAAERMQVMITDLLTYSRVTTKAHPFEQVDLQQAAEDVISDLEVRLERSGGQVLVGPLPTIEADRLQIHLLLQNLIGNALKFHRPQVPPVVRVDAWQNGGDGEQLLITVADNGIGFDVSQLERIFRPFERLHGRGEYEGTGMGLAICQKIVERHGGSITAESTPGEGTVFRVTLPVQQRAASLDQAERGIEA